MANNLTSWECVLRRRGQCKARIKLTVTDDFVEQTDEHTHPPNQTQCEVVKLKAGIKRQAEATFQTSQQIHANQLTGISEGAAINLPSVETLRRNIRSVRQERNLPPLPINIAAIPAIPHEFQITENGEQFLLYDSGVGDEERILVFGSPQGLQLLSQSDNWYADGTFKVIPEVFYQLYTVHAQCGDRIFPCIFTLLPNKTEDTYTRLLREIVARINGNGPGQILVDFERAAINAFIATIPNAVIKGCFYHLCSNVWKHIHFQPTIRSPSALR